MITGLTKIRYSLTLIKFPFVSVVPTYLNCGTFSKVMKTYTSGSPGSIPGTTRKNVLGLERGPLSLVSTTEELLGRKVAALSIKPRIRP
jgi:hypothetical protein